MLNYGRVLACITLGLDSLIIAQDGSRLQKVIYVVDSLCNLILIIIILHFICKAHFSHPMRLYGHYLDTGYPITPCCIVCCIVTSRKITLYERNGCRGYVLEVN